MHVCEAVIFTFVHAYVCLCVCIFFQCERASLIVSETMTNCRRFHPLLLGNGSLAVISRIITKRT